MRSTILWPAHHCDYDGLKKQQTKARGDSGNNEPTLAHLREYDEVQRNEKSGQNNGHAPRTMMNIGRMNRAKSKEINRTMRQ